MVLNNVTKIPKPRQTIPPYNDLREDREKSPLKLKIRDISVELAESEEELAN